MNVKIKKFNVDMEIKNNGIELDVTDNADQHMGDLVITKTKLIWCRGRTRPSGGCKLSWDRFIDMMERGR